MCGRRRWAGRWWSVRAGWCISGRLRSGTAVAEQRAEQRAERVVGAVVPGGGRVPTVIVDDLHIVYRVHGACTWEGSATSALGRLLLRWSLAYARSVL